MADRPASSESYWSADGITLDEARWRLARFLYETIEHMDPSGRKSWPELDTYDRAFYHEVISSLLDMEGLLKVALGEEPRR